MERHEQRGGGGKRGGGGSSGGPREEAAGPGGAVVQRTQVLLLSGEPWGLDGGQTVFSSFAHHVLPRRPDAPPGEAARGAAAAERAPAPAPAPPPDPSSPPPLPLPASSSGQLVFFLCRAASLREREERLREVLEGVREQVRGAPAVLVGVVVQPPPAEEREALRHLEGLLGEVFRRPSGEGAAPPTEVHTAVFAPGRPGGALELQRVRSEPLASRRSVSALWSDKSLMMQIFGLVVSFGTMAYGTYYFYKNPPL